jgi:hypothetical protein
MASATVAVLLSPTKISSPAVPVNPSMPVVSRQVTTRDKYLIFKDFL